jgi:hypothetical protein
MNAGGICGGCAGLHQQLLLQVVILQYWYIHGLVYFEEW